MLQPCDLRVEYLENPIGMDEAIPRFSYKLRGNGSKQVRRILTLKDHTSILWEKEEESSETIQLEYDGKALQPFTAYEWSVSVLDDLGEYATASARFETGFMDEAWQAAWITKPDPENKSLLPVQRFFRIFDVGPDLVSARLYFTALGLCAFRINGRDVTEDQFLPGWTDYRVEVPYVAYDVTALLHPGTNRLDADLADGWFNGAIGRGRNGGKDAYGPYNLLKAELHLHKKDGTKDVIVTDRSFQYRSEPCPIRFSDIYMGEKYDATLEDQEELPVPAIELEAPAKTVWHRNEAVRGTVILKPQTITRTADGRFLVDFGQMIAGRERLVLRNMPRGTEIVIRHAEILRGGEIYTESLRAAEAQNTYICSGKCREVCEAHYTYFGFRYLEISGLKALEKDQITARVLTSIRRQTGTFHCSDPLIDRLIENVRWTGRNNAFEVPTDCPQRNERLGWTGDAQMFMNIATYLYDGAPFYNKWCQDIFTASHCGKDGCFPIIAPYFETDLVYSSIWSDSGLIVPLIMYRKYGDKRLLEQGYEKMANWMEKQKLTARDDKPYIVDSSRYGDWLYADRDTDHRFVATAVWHGMHLVMAEIAGVTGRSASDVQYWRDQAEKIRSAFLQEFFDAEEGLREKTQTAAVLALEYQLVREGENACAQTVDFLLDDIRNTQKMHITTGLAGIAHILRVLEKTGNGELIYDLLQQKTCPSWLYQVLRGGTTVWEHWDSLRPDDTLCDPEMNSFCHVALGSCMDWLFEGICGIRSAGEAFRKIRLSPVWTKKLDFAEAAFESPRGTIVSAWKNLPDGSVEWRITIPPNTEAEAVLPDGSLRTLMPGEHLLRSSF